jgi:hypothetical protein
LADTINTKHDINIKLRINKAEAIFNSTSGVKQGDNLPPVLFLFVIQATIDTMHQKWSSVDLASPQLEWYPNAKGFLNKRSPKSGTRLDHKDTFYADDSAFIFLSKTDLIKGTEFVRSSFAQFYRVHKVIPVGLYGLGAYVWRAYFLYRAEPDSFTTQRATSNKR